MPNYDYVCEKCGHRFEVFQSMNDPKLTDCPAEGCDGSVRRLLGTGAGLIFKGGGFYQTDYRSESYKSGQKKDSETGKKPAAEKSSGSDPKPSKPASSDSA
ncbi:FmdB family transcriptional regulator [Haloferula helveola]|uniref:FmdB family transcriptional regulator n=1 Tax=Haloferula helveola TaxID=490095 RepID=A0ABM7RI20_9BACT|nr:FmdB family transcriptional regulator [Haloferula helveola]